MEKQIEEIGRYMAKVLYSECSLKMCEDCKWCGEKDREADCQDYLIAEHLYNAGYRKQKKGEWVCIYLNKFEHLSKHKCSECGFVNTTRYNYCPNCGAKMKGE